MYLCRVDFLSRQVYGQFSRVSFGEFFLNLNMLLTQAIGKTYPNFKKFYK